MSFISILVYDVYACFPLAFCVIHIGQWVFLVVYIVPKLWPYITMVDWFLTKIDWFWWFGGPHQRWHPFLGWCEQFFTDSVWAVWWFSVQWFFCSTLGIKWSDKELLSTRSRVFDVVLLFPRSGYLLFGAQPCFVAFCSWSPKLTACPERPVPQKKVPHIPIVAVRGRPGNQPHGLPSQWSGVLLHAASKGWVQEKDGGFTWSWGVLSRRWTGKIQIII